MPWRCGIKSRQLARSGDSSGAVTILKSMAPSALVRMNNSLPRSATEYCTPVRRAATRRGGVGEIDQPLLGGFVVAAGDHAKTAAGTFMDMGEPAGILFLVNQNIVR